MFFLCACVCMRIHFLFAHFYTTFFYEICSYKSTYSNSILLLTAHLRNISIATKPWPTESVKESSTLDGNATNDYFLKGNVFIKICVLPHNPYNDHFPVQHIAARPEPAENRNAILHIVVQQSTRFKMITSCWSHRVCGCTL